MNKRAYVTGMIAATALFLFSCGETPQQEPSPPPGNLPVGATPDGGQSPSVLGMPTSAPLVGPEPGSVKNINLPSGRSFLLHIPQDYDPGVKWPVVLAFHGWKENSEQIYGYTKFTAAQAITVYPQGIEEAWSPAPYAATTGEQDVAFVRDIIDSLRATYSVDDSRLYAVGMSNGGGFAVYLSCHMPEVFKAVASVSAAYYDTIHDSCADFPVSRLDIHGTNDPVVSYYGGIRHETPYKSVEDVLARDAERNKCTGAIETTRLSSTSLRMRWTGCESPLVHIRIGGGSHVWPGGSYDHSAEVPAGFATDAVLDFFGIPGRVAPAEAATPQP